MTRRSLDGGRQALACAGAMKSASQLAIKPFTEKVVFVAALLLAGWFLWQVVPSKDVPVQPVPARADLMQLVPAPNLRHAPLPRRGARHATFLIYSWNYAMFNQTLRNLLDEGFSTLVVRFPFYA